MTDLSAIVRFFQLTAAVLLAGGFVFALSIARPAHRRAGAAAELRFVSFLQSQLRLARCYVIISIATTLLGLWLQTLTVSTSSSAADNLGALIPLLTDTQFGKVWLLRAMILLLLTSLLFFKPGEAFAKRSPIFLWFGAALSLSFLISQSLAGHASAGDGAALLIQVSTDALHLLASGLWLGGLVPLAALLKRCVDNGDTTAIAVASSATRGFSRLALLSVAVLIVTGSSNAWSRVGAFAPLLGTPYGKLLLAKIALLLPLLAIGAQNLLKLKPQLATAEPEKRDTAPAVIRRLHRNVIIESALGVVILFIVGHLGVTPPARHLQPDWPFPYRWDWSVVDKAPKARAEVDRGMIWAAVGMIALAGGLARRRRVLAAVIGTAAAGYSAYVIHTAVSIDSYPATYKRPAVAYHAISVANGNLLYQENGCVSCHGVNGYGDGPAAQGLNPKPVDLTAPHANAHTAGDLFWWLSYGVKPLSAMPGFGQSLDEEERWDLINFIRALSSGEKARSLASIVEAQAWLLAPDFAYGTNTGEFKTLKDHRGNKVVLLVLLNPRDTGERLRQLAEARSRLEAVAIEIIVVPNPIDTLFVAGKLPGSIVSEGSREITDTYKLFARSFNDENLPITAPHVEFLIDKQGYIRARWLPAEGDGWRQVANLMKQVELLRQEIPRAPAPGDHVH